jgi:hypothetical protein
LEHFYSEREIWEKRESLFKPPSNVEESNVEEPKTVFASEQTAPNNGATSEQT